MRLSTWMLSPLAVLLTVATAHAEPIYAILNNDPAIGQQLVTFDSGTRAVTSTVLLQTANTLSPLASIDVRPATGQLYGYDAAARQLFTVNPSTGALTAVGSPLPSDAIAGGIIDFNPTVDRIRLIGSANQNLRLNPDTGAIAATDGSLAYQAGDINAGDTPSIRGIGYTNSFAGATTTTLYDIDVANDILVSQIPANDGTLQTRGLLGVDLNTGLFGTFTGFDISGGTGTAYLTDGPFAGDSTLYEVDLSSGIAVMQGIITGLPAGRTVAAIAVASPIPEPTTAVLLAGAVLGTAALRRRR